MEKNCYGCFWILLFVLNFSCVGAENSIVWGLDDEGSVAVTTAEKIGGKTAATVWDRIDGDVSNVLSVGGNLQPWILTKGRRAFVRTGVSGNTIKGLSWQEVKDSSLLVDIAVSFEGYVWGVQADGRPVFREGVTDNSPRGDRWLIVDGVDITHIAVGRYNNVWCIARDGGVYIRQGITPQNVKGKTWFKVPGTAQFKRLAVSAQGVVYGIDMQQKLLLREGVTVATSQGTRWTMVHDAQARQKFPKKFIHVALDGDAQVWVVAADKNVYQRTGVTPTNIKGTGWQKIPGTCKSLGVTTMPHTQPGGSAYTHVGPRMDDALVVFHDAWKFKEKGKGSVRFRARSKAEMYIQCSPQLRSIPNATYHLTLGGIQNTISMMNKLDGRETVVEDVRKGSNANVVITDGLPGNGVAWDDYWIAVEDGVFRWGKSPEVGEGELMRLEDAAPLKDVQYVGLGGNKSFVHEFKNIQMSGSAPLDVLVNVPTDFSEIQGRARRIAVGSKDGVLVVLALGFDDLLYRYDETAKQVPWINVAIKDKDGNVVSACKDVSIASDGTVCIITIDGKVYRYNWADDVWFLIDPGKEHAQLVFDRIAVGNEKCIWALDKATRNIYQLTYDGWKEQATGGGMDIAAGLDGTVLAVNTALEIYQFNYDTDDWEEYPYVLQLGRIDLGSADYVWGTQAVGSDFYVWNFHKGKWMRTLAADGTGASGFKQLSVNAVGTVFAVDAQGVIYKNGDMGVDARRVKSLVDQFSQKLTSSTMRGMPSVIAEKENKKRKKKGTVSTKKVLRKPGALRKIKDIKKKNIVIKKQKKQKIIRKSLKKR